MTRPIADLDVPLCVVERLVRESVERRAHAVAELPPTSWRPRTANPKPTAEEAQR